MIAPDELEVEAAVDGTVEPDDYVLERERAAAVDPLRAEESVRAALARQRPVYPRRGHGRDEHTVTLDEYRQARP